MYVLESAVAHLLFLCSQEGSDCIAHAPANERDSEFDYWSKRGLRSHLVGWADHGYMSGHVASHR